MSFYKNCFILMEAYDAIKESHKSCLPLFLSFKDKYPEMTMLQISKIASNSLSLSEILKIGEKGGWDNDEA